MNLLESYIQKAEALWLEPIYTYCRSLFSDKRIPSHDHTHHLRVWKYSKEILYALSSSYEINQELVQACLIASLFHDTGLTVMLDENHGKESKEICLRYFEQNALIKPLYFDAILDAIEKHDDKNYKSKNTPQDSVLSILCVADDLDAFGNIGVVRYTEIYLLRGVNLIDLPNLVIENLEKRFLNFEKEYKNLSDLYTKHKNRYLITREIFNDMLKEILN